jgi:hypothetical protein
LFRMCKKMKAKHNGRDFKEEYLLLRKRARSLEANKGRSHPNNASQIQSYKDEFDVKIRGRGDSINADIDNEK